MQHNLIARNNTEFPSTQQNTVSDDTHPQKSVVSQKWIWFATLGICLLELYFLLVFFYGGTIFGVPVQLRYLALTIIVSFGGIYGFLRWSNRRQLISVNLLKVLTIASITALMLIMAIDVGYSFYINATNLKQNADSFVQKDEYLSGLEQIPSRYQPTEKNFLIHKPNVSMTAHAYGGFFYPKLLNSPLVSSSALELRDISYSIDEYGFRETTPLSQARIFALGDSFTFGVDISQSKTWVERLEQRLGEPTYNLGVSSASLQDQRAILEYVLQTHPDSIKNRHLLWMIYEINALYDSNDARLQEAFKENLFKGTIVQTLNSIPLTIKNQSVINRLRTNNVTIGQPVETNDKSNPYIVDGIELDYALYHSTQYGYRLFEPADVEWVGYPESYVLNHPKLPMLHQTFEEVAALSEAYGFRVTVVAAPSAERVSAPYFEGFPPISEEPYFLNYVEQLSKDQGFDVINLYPLMQPYADKELLYWRDDSHWNERGNEVVAEIIAEHLTKQVTLHQD